MGCSQCDVLPAVTLLSSIPMDLHEGQYFDAFQKGKFSFIHLGPNNKRTTVQRIFSSFLKIQQTKDHVGKWCNLGFYPLHDFNKISKVATFSTKLSTCAVFFLPSLTYACHGDINLAAWGSHWLPEKMLVLFRLASPFIWSFFLPGSFCNAGDVSRHQYTSETTLL